MYESGISVVPIAAFLGHISEGPSCDYIEEWWKFNVTALGSDLQMPMMLQLQLLKAVDVSLGTLIFNREAPQLVGTKVDDLLLYKLRKLPLHTTEHVMAKHGIVLGRTHHRK